MASLRVRGHGSLLREDRVPKETIMYKHILIPTDGSHLSELAIRQGVRLAKTLGARVTAVTVFAPFHTIAIEPMMITDTAEQYQKECEALGEKYLRVVTDAARTADVTCEVVRVMHDHPYQAIIETADTRGCDLIFMASHGRRGMAALVLGSETTKVLTHTRVPVLVCRSS
jgi:nucleotide-binding universal stress UspA family protein